MTAKTWAVSHDAMPHDATLTAADDATLRTFIAIITEPHTAANGCDSAITRLPTRQPTLIERQTT